MLDVRSAARPPTPSEPDDDLLGRPQPRAARRAGRLARDLRPGRTVLGAGRPAAARGWPPSSKGSCSAPTASAGGRAAGPTARRAGRRSSTTRPRSSAGRAPAARHGAGPATWPTPRPRRRPRPGWPPRPRASCAPLGVAVDVRDERWLAEQGFGGVLAVGGGSVAPPRLIEAPLAPARRARATARRARRQGHHLRHRRHQPQARRRHAHDAHRHGRRRRRRWPRCESSRGRGCRCGSPCWCPRPRTPVRRGSYRPGDVVRHSAGAPARSPTPTPRAASCWPTRWPTPSPGCARPCSSTSPR